MGELGSAIRSAFESQLFSGGFALMVVGAVMALLRSVPFRALAVLKRRIVVEVEVLSSDPLFGFVTVWLDAQLWSRDARSLTASMRANSSAAERRPNPIVFTPAPGNHLFWYRGRPIWLIRERTDSKGERGWDAFRETIKFRMLGKDPSAARALLREAHDLATDDDRRVSVHTLVWSEWRRLTEVRPRPLSSVFLPKGELERLVADATEFLAAESWYSERGIPWRRAYLLEGLPGAGKTSAIGALAGHLGMDLYICGLAGKEMDDNRLVSGLLNVPARSIILLEDVDCVASGRDMQGESGVTFAGLLNALDGVASRPGVLTFLTTNHVEKLDPALVRPGRVDTRLHFGAATREQLVRMFLHFYGKPELRDLAEAFAVLMEGRVMAHAQQVLLDHKDAPHSAVDSVQAARGA
ncbi:MAG TPA: AAA family ATPase [Longimicrobium sp.]|jgi:chaperone BCS1